MRIIASLRPRWSVRGEETHPTSGESVCLENGGSKGINLGK